MHENYRYANVPMSIFLNGRWMLTHKIHHHVAYLQVSVHHIVCVKVLVVLAVRIEQSLGRFKPTNVKKKLQHGKNGDNIVNIGIRIAIDILLGI